LSRAIMSEHTLRQGNTLTDRKIVPRAWQIRLAISKGSAKLPRFLRPGLLLEAFSLAAAMKNRYQCVRGLYFRDRAPVQVEFRNGMRLQSSRRDSLFFLLEEIVAARCYTPCWFYRPGPADTVVDVGANIGVFAAHICSLSPGARVVCFEPDPWSYGTLLRNVSASHLAHRVQLHQAAVWREQGTVNLALSDNDNSLGQRIGTRADGAAKAVKCLSLEQALDMADPTGGPVALLKVDTEGAETEILEAAGAAAMQRVQRVALEYHSVVKRKRSDELLRSYGFGIRLGRGDADTGICLASRSV
jgi:FkbM family methyltransferase